MLEWIVMAIGIGGMYGVLIERHWLDVRQVNLVIPQLPASFTGFKVALFSDIHLGFFYQPKQLARFVRRVNRLNPDVICFTGDLLDSPIGYQVLAPAVEELSKLNAPYGKLAVIGNHDHYSGAKKVIQGLQQGGFTVLQNDHHMLEKGGERLYFLGLDDVLDGKPNLREAIMHVPSTECKILLVHEPDYAATAPAAPIALQLSGHSHGGQVRLPFIGPILTTKLGKQFSSGFYRGKSWSIYTTRGIGTTHLPIRFFCRPELSLITLTQL